MSSDDAKRLLGYEGVEGVYLSMQTPLTMYAAKQGATSVDYEGESSCSWWLKDSGIYGDTVLYVNDNGDIALSDVNANEIAVRPAIWVKLAS